LFEIDRIILDLPSYKLGKTRQLKSIGFCTRILHLIFFFVLRFTLRLLLHIYLL